MAKRRRLGSVLGRLEHVLERLKRQKSEQSESAVPGTQLQLALGKHNIYEEENLQTSTRPPYNRSRHAAGPLRARCGYPKRSKAAYPPPRLVLEHKVLKY